MKTRLGAKYVMSLSKLLTKSLKRLTRYTNKVRLVYKKHTLVLLNGSMKSRKIHISQKFFNRNVSP